MILDNKLILGIDCDKVNEDLKTALLKAAKLDPDIVVVLSKEVSRNDEKIEMLELIKSLWHCGHDIFLIGNESTAPENTRWMNF